MQTGKAETRNARRRCAVGVTVGLVLGCAAPAAMAAPSEVPPDVGTTVVLDLPGGGRVAGGAGLTVSAVSASSRGAPGGSIVITPYEAVDTADAAAAYERAGRSPAADAIAAGVSSAMVAKMRLATAQLAARATGAGTIYDSFCAYDDEVYMTGEACVIRTYDPNERIAGYGIKIDQTQADGHENSPYFYDDLHKLSGKNQYAQTQLTIVSKAPASDITNVAACRSQTVGASYGGVGATIGGTICPDRWDASFSSGTTYPKYHKNEWQGESNDDREANLVTIVKIKDNYTTGYSLVLGWDVH